MKQCEKCKTGGLFCYSVMRNKVFCLPCWDADVQERKFIVSVMEDVKDVDPPLGWNTTTEMFVINREFEHYMYLTLWDH